jgi:hypothetical protein
VMTGKVDFTSRTWGSSASSGKSVTSSRAARTSFRARFMSVSGWNLSKISDRPSCEIESISSSSSRSVISSSILAVIRFSTSSGEAPVNWVVIWTAWRENSGNSSRCIRK